MSDVKVNDSSVKNGGHKLVDTDEYWTRAYLEGRLSSFNKPKSYFRLANKKDGTPLTVSVASGDMALRRKRSSRCRRLQELRMKYRFPQRRRFRSKSLRKLEEAV